MTIPHHYHASTSTLLKHYHNITTKNYRTKIPPHLCTYMCSCVHVYRKPYCNNMFPGKPREEERHGGCLDGNNESNVCVGRNTKPNSFAKRGQVQPIELILNGSKLFFKGVFCATGQTSQEPPKGLPRANQKLRCLISIRSLSLADAAEIRCSCFEDSCFCCRTPPTSTAIGARCAPP
jgi:hypothetical protein